MLTSWNESIFSEIKLRLQEGAMNLIQQERCGEAFDSQLVIGVRESYGMYVLIAIRKSSSMKIIYKSQGQFKLAHHKPSSDSFNNHAADGACH